MYGSVQRSFTKNPSNDRTTVLVLIAFGSILAQRCGAFFQCFDLSFCLLNGHILMQTCVCTTAAGSFRTSSVGGASHTQRALLMLGGYYQEPSRAVNNTTSDLGDSVLTPNWHLMPTDSGQERFNSPNEKVTNADGPHSCT